MREFQNKTVAKFSLVVVTNLRRRIKNGKENSYASLIAIAGQARLDYHLK